MLCAEWVGKELLQSISIVILSLKLPIVFWYEWLYTHFSARFWREKFVYLKIYIVQLVFPICIFQVCNYHLLVCSCWSNHLQPDLGKQDSHHFECHLVSRLPQVLLLHCVPLHPRWLHPCHPTCRQWHLPHSDLPPTRHHLQDWGGGCEEGRQSRRTEGKGHGDLHY